MCEEEFWRENKSVDEDGDGDGWAWAWRWTLAVILFIFICRLLSSRFRFFFGVFTGRFLSSPSPSSSSSSSSSIPDGDAQSSLSLRTPEIISDLDLKNLIDNLDENSPDNVWENVVDKTTNFISYRAKCCKPKDGPLKYLSVTTFEDCSVEALVNFYMDNHYRVQWDKTVIHHQQLQVDQGSGTEIGRTIKKFPFLTPREYVLAWRLWQGIDGSFYCFIPGRNACEIIMVHQEDAGLNVEMAKLAFAKGIWSYVCKMDDALRKYSAGRLQPHSSARATKSIQKVPSEFEPTNSMIGVVCPENSMITVNDHLGTRKSKMWKLTGRPSNKLMTNGLVLLGGAICLSRGHSSLGAKVAMAYVLSKLTKRGAPPEQAGKLLCNEGS
ncbi:hypothetical protein BUALT_Bualt07G0177600 [Buddleja alternifolia]|uniref:START domain-containing protein n=1 Tax=Buddleja alternifolia TaxID=168488 RepID=A0AAV6XIQ8_9LAMI|nr:hypothetical protein BUALT_Bualt07G0177600 [Buddleja alternifolia]